MPPHATVSECGNSLSAPYHEYRPINSRISINISIFVYATLSRIGKCKVCITAGVVGQTIRRVTFSRVESQGYARSWIFYDTLLRLTDEYFFFSFFFFLTEKYDRTLSLRAEMISTTKQKKEEILSNF